MTNRLHCVRAIINIWGPTYDRIKTHTILRNVDHPHLTGRRKEDEGQPTLYQWKGTVTIRKRKVTVYAYTKENGGKPPLEWSDM